MCLSCVVLLCPGGERKGSRPGENWTRESMYSHDQKSWPTLPPLIADVNTYTILPEREKEREIASLMNE